jgi:oligopeptide/dipeptide ABC transporter ATP-binding protein
MNATFESWRVLWGARPRLRPVRAFFRLPDGKVSAFTCAALVVVAVFAPIVFGEEARTLHFDQADMGASWSHPFGTDSLGRDIFLRVLVATRLSLILAVIATVCGCAAGGIFGAACAIQRGRVRSGLLRVIDILQSFPTILVAIFVVAILGPGERAVLIGTALGIAFAFSRVTSTLAMSVSGREFMAAGRVLGASRLRLITRYALPNAADALLITFAVTMSRTVITISALSFLGLGIQAPTYDWGSLLSDGIKIFYEQPMAALGPSIAIAVAALAFGFLGEAMARASNPRLWVTRTPLKERSLRLVGNTDLQRESTSVSVPPDQEMRARTDVGAVAPTLLDVRDLCVSVPKDGLLISAVHDVTFSIGRGEMIGIVGESGSGKTLTSLGIGSLLPPAAQMSGRVAIDGQDLQGMKQRERKSFLGGRISYVFQDPTSSLSPSVRIGTQICEGMIAHLGVDKDTAMDRAQKALDHVGITTPARVMRQYPHELSGGMRQRVSIAAALLTQPELVIADEPTTSLDVVVQTQVMDLISDVHVSRQTSVILISHNLPLVAERCSRILIMYAGTVVEDGPASRVLNQPAHPYTRALINAVPDLHSSRVDSLIEIKGAPPPLGGRPLGCAYHPRCELVRNICRVESPQLTSVGDGTNSRVSCWAAPSHAERRARNSAEEEIS